VSVSPLAAFPDTKRLAVLDFAWKPPAQPSRDPLQEAPPPDVGKLVADSVSARLVCLPGYEVLERSKVAKLLSKPNPAQAELLRQAKHQEMGEALGADFLVLGNVATYRSWTKEMQSGHAVCFSCRCVDVGTSKVVWTISGAVEHSPYGPVDPATGLAEILNDAIPKLKQQIETRRFQQALGAEQKK